MREYICECMRKSLLLDLSLSRHCLYQEQTSGPDGRYKAKRLNRKNNIAKDQRNEKPVTVRTKEKIRRSCFDSLGILSMVFISLFDPSARSAHISAHRLCSLSNLNLNKEKHSIAKAHSTLPLRRRLLLLHFFFVFFFSNISGEGPP